MTISTTAKVMVMRNAISLMVMQFCSCANSSTKFCSFIFVIRCETKFAMMKEVVEQILMPARITIVATVVFFILFLIYKMRCSVRTVDFLSFLHFGEPSLAI